MSELKEQHKRFEEVITENGLCIVRCVFCPLKEKCEDPNRNYDFEHTCEETLWHYIQTGEFLK